MAPSPPPLTSPSLGVATMRMRGCGLQQWSSSKDILMFGSYQMLSLLSSHWSDLKAALSPAHGQRAADVQQLGIKPGKEMPSCCPTRKEEFFCPFLKHLFKCGLSTISSGVRVVEKTAEKSIWIWTLLLEGWCVLISPHPTGNTYIRGCRAAEVVTSLQPFVLFHWKPKFGCV